MRLMGIDYGTRRIGIAASEGIFASGIAECATSEATAQLKQLLKKYPAEVIVIGLPQGRLAPQVRRFGEMLKKELVRDIRYFDETLTTKTARQVLVMSGKGRKTRRQKEHQTAAAVLLQSYIERRE